MNYIDIILIILFIWFGFKGFTKGLIIELASIVALSLGVHGGLKFSYIISNLLIDDLDEKYLPIVSFTITFAVIVACVFVLGKLIEKVVNLAALKLINKLGGAAFGVLKIAIITSVLITIIESYDRKLGFIPTDVKSESMLYNPMLDLAGNVLPVIEKNQLLQQVKQDMTSNEIEPKQ